MKHDAELYVLGGGRNQKLEETRPVSNRTRGGRADLQDLNLTVPIRLNNQSFIHVL